ncbi:MAG: helix-turn-helix domain-containing protein [Candidatus Gastranaerophilales bacterium]|nr:helix-turn-helix domain-containing protein [Candidatus Gastranaerophilales bacterium]
MIEENLKKIRTELGLSVAKFADKLEMSANTITNYEQNRREPSLNLFVQLNKKLNVNLNWFVSGEGEMFNAPKPEQTLNFTVCKTCPVQKQTEISSDNIQSLTPQQYQKLIKLLDSIQIF